MTPYAALSSPQQPVHPRHRLGARRRGRRADHDHVVRRGLLHHPREPRLDLGVRPVEVVEPALDHDQVRTAAQRGGRAVRERDPAARRRLGAEPRAARTRPRAPRPAAATATTAPAGPARAPPTTSRRSRRPAHRLPVTCLARACDASANRWHGRHARARPGRRDARRDQRAEHGHDREQHHATARQEDPREHAQSLRSAARRSAWSGGIIRGSFRRTPEGSDD